MNVFKWWIFWLVLYHSVDTNTAGKIQTFKNSKRIPAFGLFKDKKPPTWEQGHIVGYSLNSAKGELHFKSKTRKTPTIFTYPSLFGKLYLDKTPKWGQLTVGKTVLVELKPGKFLTGKIVGRTNSTSTSGHKNGGKVTVKKWKITKKFDYRNVRIKGMDVCRFFEVDCDIELEDCQLIYLNKWLPAPAQYNCSCKKGFKKHPKKKCIAIKPTELPSTKTTVRKQPVSTPKKRLKQTAKKQFESTTEKQIKPTEKKQLTDKTAGQKESKSNIGVILGSLSACLVVIIVTGVVLWKNFPKRISSEERLRRQVIEEMEETWKDEETSVQEKTLLTKISDHLQNLSAKLKKYFAGLIQRLREKIARNKKVDSQTAIEKSSSENLRSEIRNGIKEALARKTEQ
ncbi:uncharacterized protein LOC144628010 [Oculina patagonica]